jgi:hypothetical protein
MVKNKNILIFVLQIFSRFCWAGLTYSFVGLMLVFLNINNYHENVNTYTIGLIVCLIWLLIRSIIRGNIDENN